MKNVNITFAIIPLLVGLGVSTSASANNQELLTALNKTIEVQGQQVTQSIAIKIKQSYQADIAFMAKKAATQWNEKKYVIANNTLNKIINTTDLDE